MRLRILLTLLYPHRVTLLVGLLLGLLASAAGLATPLVTKWVLDSLATADTADTLVGPVVWLLALVIAGAVVSFAQWILFGRLGEQVVLAARRMLVGTVLRARVGSVARTPSGEVVTRVTSDTGLLHQASASLVGLVNAVVMLVGTLVLMLVLDPPLLGITVVAVGVITALMVLLLPRIAVAEARAQEAVGNIGSTLEGAVRAIRTVKASRAETRILDSIGSHIDTAARFGVRSAVTQAWVWTIAWTGLQLAIIVILGVGAWRVAQGDMPVSTLIAFLLYAFGLMGPLTELTQNLTALQSGIAAAERIGQMDRFEPEPTTVPDGPMAPADAGTPCILEFDDVSARYGPDAGEAVAGITLGIPRRGHLAIVGPSGAGKTTLLSLLLRFLEPSAGGMVLDGRPYAQWTPQQVRARLAYVEQETPLVPGTVRENITFTHPDASDEEVAAALAAVRLTDVVAALPHGLDTSLQAGELSGGQRQRVAVARAVLRTPDVLILDEATAQVDGVTEQALQRCITDVASRAAVVTVAHRLSTVLDADRIVVMDGGRIRDIGTHEALLGRDALYRELVVALRIHDDASDHPGQSADGVRRSAGGTGA
ncbi:ABC transporter ATP-binding protein [Arthrobacter ruber]|uniref:ABC transporter ATP-binding protein n=1 Tax=Arthrobacter ruber TaxID=1258893 RepID=UPI0014761C13|nr:ABC transporter ATP-binding protein [Arthrobacter ruber]